MTEQVAPEFFKSEVPVDRLDEVREKLAKLSKRAVKLGLPPLALEVSAPFVKVVRRQDPNADSYANPEAYYTVKYEAVNVSVTGPEKVKLNGFEFLGRVDNEAGAALVSTVPGKAIPEKYRTPDNYCDHCKQVRARKSYYIFQSEAGDHVKVGSTCLKDYMGHNSSAVLWLSSLESELGGSFEGFGAGAPVYFKGLLLAMTAAVIRDKGGYVSRAAAQAYAEKVGEDSSGYLPTTASFVSEQLMRKLPKGVKRVELKEVDRRVAQKAVAWFKASVAEKSSLSDYEHNLMALVDQPTVHMKRLGIMVSLVGVYLRAMGELAQRQARVNAHVGKVGERRKFSGKFVSQRSFDGNFGPVIYTKVYTPEGMVTVKSSTQWWDGDLEKDRELSFVATVKKHSQWKEFLETEVNRAKMA